MASELFREYNSVRARQRTAELGTNARLKSAIERLKALRGGVPVSLKALQDAEAEVRAVAKSLSGDQKSVGTALNRLGKAFDTHTASGLSNLCAPKVLLRADKINECVTDHLFREGLFSLAEMFAEEAGVPVDGERVAPFRRLHVMLDAFRRGELGPAISWASEHSSSGSGSTTCSDLEMRLHRLAYLRLLQAGRRSEALAYAQREFQRFPEHVGLLGKLMTCLLYAGKLDESPYRAWVADAHRDDIARALTREYCASLALSPESELVTIVRCGAKAIPQLLKAARVAPNWKDLKDEHVLPVEVDVGRDCQFHSIFICPVSREETMDTTNGPMLLPCGHVLSRNSIQRLPKGQLKFKCPYCPNEQMEKDCLQVCF